MPLKRYDTLRNSLCLLGLWYLLPAENIDHIMYVTAVAVLVKFSSEIDCIRMDLDDCLYFNHDLRCPRGVCLVSFFHVGGVRRLLPERFLAWKRSRLLDQLVSRLTYKVKSVA